ncbi:MAG: YqgE/AlgH family protein [Pseudomonadales bacterium]|jgi:putative transcriptional regulator|nr:YqgE/AlgH family protein [Pseudomonadales bacterium]MDP6469463.1 YqgE/AlgH family protein [Pseudomonadales bacterium]MDP6827305.1 YqgE/AlgH family protein [Pseudomonadales bacterium]MDP6971128.1 YqgE/AlgH family protein [Pseudomonadales bacterium]|tara:strand:- start:8713 stop:9267 length:555 start_codon:yes stop_codon:yes gene_type:complete
MNLKHHFLIAMPNLTGTYFGGTVTYLCEHSDDGAMGLIINRPSELSVAELCDQSELTVGSGQDLATVPVLEGGPVSSEQGFVLHSDDGHFTESAQLGHGLNLTTALGMLEAIAQGKGPYNYLVALGYAGWGSGQLEGELAENAWLTCPATLEILFDVPFEQRVQRAAATLGIDFSLISGQAGHA